MKMEKIKLLSISKSERRSAYGFHKEQRLFKIIRNILSKLDFEYDDIKDFARPCDNEGVRNLDKEDNIRKYNGRIIPFHNEIYALEIVFFSKKVVLIFHYREDKQQELTRVLDEFISEEEIVK